jgi:PIN domain nuclease of toxin-antitoxin system
MIVLDTHIFIWLLNQEDHLSTQQKTQIQSSASIGLSAISLWEIAKLVENGRLTLSVPVLDWINSAPTYPGIQVIPLSPAIVVQSTQLLGDFHRDPADQLIVATALVLDCPLLTQDSKILAYPHVQTI